MTNTPKRPADVIGNAVRVAQITTGEAEEVVKLRLQGRLYRWATIRREGHTFRKRGSAITPLTTANEATMSPTRPQNATRAFRVIENPPSVIDRRQREWL